MRILNSVLYDIKFQMRHGFYYAYIIVSLFYIGILRFIPYPYKTTLGTLIIFSDPSFLGALFIGGIFLLEREQNTLENIFITPLKVGEYIWSKVISLTIISLLSSSFITIITFKWNVNIFLFLTGVTLSSIFYTLLGFIIVVYSKNLNDYLLNSFITTIFVLPVLEYLEVYSSPIFYLLPGKGAIELMNGAFKSISSYNILYSIILLILWCAVAYIILVKIFNKKIILRIGEK
ncbi:hypothetical protein GCM10008905_07910 [Clostridium malenominatum]|uniref:ABC transporter permease n=1 Tax=Clostridium malenominatum TaxID=1539 RepID=A0ABP3TXB8_9CLOT